MHTTNRTLVGIATYNERENLPHLVDEVFGRVPTADVLVVDDNSPDGTGEWSAERASKDRRLRCIHRPGKLGLGTATIAAMKYAIQSEYDYLVMMDADFSHDPKYLPALVAAMSPEETPPLDVAIGSRYVVGGGTVGWDLRRRLMSRGVNLYARWLLGLTPNDCSGAYRCFRTRTLARLDFAAIRSRGYSFQEEILYHLKVLGARFGEVPIRFVDRKQGRSKLDAREALRSLGVIFRLALHRRRQPRAFLAQANRSVPRQVAQFDRSRPQERLQPH